MKMIFDFETFRKLVKWCYEPGPYSLEEVLTVFKYYFYRYEQEFEEPHPNIRMAQIRRIIYIMPYFSEEEAQENTCETVPFGAYGCIIDRHFQTQYRSCDYNVNHFFSGKIRELRWREAERGE